MIISIEIKSEVLLQPHIYKILLVPGTFIFYLIFRFTSNGKDRKALKPVSLPQLVLLNQAMFLPPTKCQAAKNSIKNKK